MSIKLIVLCFVGLALLAGSVLSAAPEPAGTATGNPVVIIETSMGTITAELFQDKAPITVKNFLGYVEDKTYDGTIFHRVMETFMIQGGGFDKDMKKKMTKDPIKNESANGLSNLKGTLAMARLGRDVGAVRAGDSATNQFFINVEDNKGLDKAQSMDGVGYCVFGRVTEGMDVVEKIKKVKTGNHAASGMDDVPLDTVTIKSVKKK